MADTVKYRVRVEITLEVDAVATESPTHVSESAYRWAETVCRHAGRCRPVSIETRVVQDPHHPEA